MTEDKPHYKISKDITRRCNGTVLEENYSIVEGERSEEVEKMFDKRWEGQSDNTR